MLELNIEAFQTELEPYLLNLRLEQEHLHISSFLNHKHMKKISQIQDEDIISLNEYKCNEPEVDRIADEWVNKRKIRIEQTHIKYLKSID
jgi:hypothetical protein